ncbi:MAG: diguanylate cyclase [Magnetococcales bacterium]|nr:diguanylate cyclase [Magnetococcales bacterium]
MWTRQSLIYPILAMLALTALASIVSGYYINYLPVHKNIHRDLALSLETVREAVQTNLDEELLGLDRLARVLQGDRLLKRGLVKHSEDPEAGLNILRRKLDVYFPGLGADLLLIVDAKGGLIYRAHAPGDQSPTPLTPGIEKALAGETVRITLEDERGLLHAVHTPLFDQGNVQGVVVVGNRIGPPQAAFANSRFDTLVSIALPGKVLSDPLASPGNWLPISDARVKKAIALEKPLFWEEHDLARAQHIAPIHLGDRTLAIVTHIDLVPSHGALFQSSYRLMWLAVVLFMLVLLLGIGAYYFLIHPLRKLFAKASVLLDVCATSVSDDVTNSGTATVDGNEIKRLDHALEMASFTVYAHIGQLHEQKEKFANMAVKDPLTGLGNRRLFDDILSTALALCQRHGGQLAVFYLDLDHFKPINDTLGHDIGDLLLKEVAGRLHHTLRDSDAVFRLGGDEFAAILTQCADEKIAMTLAGRLNDVVSKPYRLNGHVCKIGVSIGIAIFPIHGADAKELLKRADTALYAAKEGGRGNFRVYDHASEAN